MSRRFNALRFAVFPGRVEHAARNERTHQSVERLGLLPLRHVEQRRAPSL